MSTITNLVVVATLLSCILVGEINCSFGAERPAGASQQKLLKKVEPFLQRRLPDKFKEASVISYREDPKARYLLKIRLVGSDDELKYAHLLVSVRSVTGAKSVRLDSVKVVESESSQLDDLTEPMDRLKTRQKRNLDWGLMWPDWPPRGREIKALASSLKDQISKSIGKPITSLRVVKFLLRSQPMTENGYDSGKQYAMKLLIDKETYVHVGVASKPVLEWIDPKVDRMTPLNFDKPKRRLQAYQAPIDKILDDVNYQLEYKLGYPIKTIVHDNYHIERATRNHGYKYGGQVYVIDITVNGGERYRIRVFVSFPTRTILESVENLDSRPARVSRRSESFNLINIRYVIKKLRGQIEDRLGRPIERLELIGWTIPIAPSTDPAGLALPGTTYNIKFRINNSQFIHIKALVTDSNDLVLTDLDENVDKNTKLEFRFSRQGNREAIQDVDQILAQVREQLEAKLDRPIRSLERISHIITKANNQHGYKYGTGRLYVFDLLIDGSRRVRAKAFVMRDLSTLLESVQDIDDSLYR